MKKLIVLITALAMLFAIAGCAKTPGDTDTTGPVDDAAARQDGKLVIYTSIYPMQYFTEQIAGERAVVKSIIPAGTEPHDWEPNPGDIVNLEKADVFVYNGAGMEHWVDKVLNSLDNKDLLAIEASDDITLLEGHHHHHEDAEDAHDDHDDDHDADEHDHDDDHDHDTDVTEHADEHDHDADEHEHDDEHDHDADEHDHDHDGDDHHDHDHGEFDPHVWLAPLKAAEQVDNIRNGLNKKAPEYAETFNKNADALIQRLQELDHKFKEGLKDRERDDIVVNHEAFGYLCNAYGLNQVGITGIYADSEPSPAKMKEIVDFVKANDVRYIFTEELLSQKVAEVIAAEAGVEVAVLSPLEGLSAEQQQAGDDYFTIMEKNLEVLEQAVK